MSEGTTIGEQYGTNGVTLSIPFVSPIPHSPSMSLTMNSGINTITYTYSVIDPIWFPQMLDLFSCPPAESPAQYDAPCMVRGSREQGRGYCPATSRPATVYGFNATSVLAAI